MIRCMPSIWWILIGVVDTKRNLYIVILRVFWIPSRFLWRFVICYWSFFFNRNRGRSICLISGTKWKDCFIKQRMSWNEHSVSCSRPEVISLCVRFIPNEYHLLSLRRQLISSLFWGYKHISVWAKYPEVWNIRFVSIEDFNGCPPLMTTHGLLVVDMQGCFNCVLPEGSRQTSMLLYGFSFFKQSSIEPLCMTILLGCMGNWGLMSDASGWKERLKLFAQEFPPTVWTYRGEQLTGEDLSQASHRLKMLCNSVFVTYERNKCYDWYFSFNGLSTFSWVHLILSWHMTILSQGTLSFIYFLMRSLSLLCYHSLLLISVLCMAMSSSLLFHSDASHITHVMLPFYALPT